MSEITKYPQEEGYYWNLSSNGKLYLVLIEYSEQRGKPMVKYDSLYYHLDEVDGIFEKIHPPKDKTLKEAWDKDEVMSGGAH